MIQRNPHEFEYIVSKKGTDTRIGAIQRQVTYQSSHIKGKR